MNNQDSLATNQTAMGVGKWWNWLRLNLEKDGSQWPLLARVVAKFTSTDKPVATVPHFWLTVWSVEGIIPYCFR